MNIPRNDMRQAMQGKGQEEGNNGIINVPAQQDKPVVHFKEIGASIAIGSRAFVIPIDHPSDLVSNTTWVLTTPVQSFVSDGKGIVSFETLNTRYVRA